MLEGKTALITGGSSGIGLATARLLLQRGASVAITGTDQAKLAAAKLDLSQQHNGNAVMTIRADVSNAEHLVNMRTTLEREFGKLDVVFANAGVAYGTPLGNTDEERYDRLMDINVKGTFFSIQSVLPLMSFGGSIILNTSWLNQIGTPGKAVLSASKAAVRSFARTMSAELVEQGIRVNCVSPGTIQTPLHRAPNETDQHFAEYAERIGRQTPIGYMGQPEDIAGVVAFLASDASRYMLGAEIVVDGGRAEL